MTLAIGNGELKNPLGDTVRCSICGEEHPVQTANGKDMNGNETSLRVHWYKCGDTTLMAGLDGMALPGVES